MSRSVMRFVPHTIRHVAEGGATFEAFCATSGCDATSDPHEAQETAQDWCLRHTGRTGHDLFRRIATDHARVTRDE
ncbi:DUF7848 domain-containing protein [Streptomyces sp. NBC_01483]|uniref:DUF7848 domain-containing protein n=1 Tax=Streptomyces sp. NBC_01483 TaxID=2903883 RepID=UPI002E2F013C|nr:hypothetical protein [Streptomyces sp. NBC_01483]